MKTLMISDLKPGMKLSKSVYNYNNSIELLAKDTVLSSRKIYLLENSGIDSVEVYEHKDIIGQENVDVEAIEKDLEEDVEEILTNVVNQNMVIHKLTGEGNKPIDEVHEETIEETKEIFQHLEDKDSLDIESIEENVKKMLPDMIKNDDVLMRLQQLKQTDNYTFEHSLRVSILAANIAKWLGYSKQQIEEVAEAGLLFDIGKMKVPNYIIKKSSRVTDDEFELIKKHCQLGYRILLQTKGVSASIKYAALQHHERMDGSGYPLRLRAGQIHEYAKIIMVCDVFDAMISDKPYGMGVSIFEAAEYIDWNANNLFSEKVVYFFLRRISEYFLGKKVVLSNGMTGRIVYVDKNSPMRPFVKVDGEIIKLTEDRSIKIEKLA